MKTLTKPIELTGVIDERHRLLVDDIVVPLDSRTRVRIFVLPEYDDISEEDWMRGLASNPVFDFLKHPAEDIYTFEDGKPYHAKG